MISVTEAFELLKKNLPAKNETKLSLIDALNCTLSRDILSPINMPPFRQSAMDGYALNYNNTLSYEIIGEIKAGDEISFDLQQGQAVKIFTGAAVPNSANTVIQIEKVVLEENKILLNEEFNLNVNIKAIGEQIKENEIALKSGTKLNPAAIGFLAGLGITAVDVYKKPSVGILITGNELVKLGEMLTYGKVYESNSIMLQAALLNIGFDKINMYEVNDDFERTKDKIETAISENDILLISGGISVGDYDFVKASLDKLGVQTLFYKVNQKPGKPLLTGKINEKIIFALPGNPAASLTCYYIYVEPLLKAISGENNFTNSSIQQKLAHSITVNNTRNQFLKGSLKENKVSVLSHQQSSMLNSFALANCLIYIPAGNYELQEGSLVDIYHIL